MKVPPLPIAALLLRARNAKSAKERHDLAYFGWEASVRLAVAARPPEDRARLAMPSTGDWTAVFVAGAGDRILDEPALLAVQQLLGEEAHGRAGAPRSTTAAKLLEPLAGYRNAVLGHGAVRAPTFYEHAGEVLAAGLDAAWRADVFWPDDARLVLVDAVEVDAAGARRGRVLDLTGAAAVVVDPRGTVVGDDVLPHRLYQARGGGYRSLHPWLLYEAAELRERVLFFNGRGRAARFLDYVGGEQLKAKALAAVCPTVEADLDAAMLPGRAAADDDEPADATRFGDYRILGKLGEGGMGVVYLARQETLDRTVALKMLPPGASDDPVAVARFRREVAALARCEHPNVVKVLAVGVHDGRPYYTMEVVDGADLAHVARGLAGGATLDQAVSTASAHVRALRRSGAARAADDAVDRDDTAAVADAFPDAPALPRDDAPALPARARDRLRALVVMFRDAARALAHLHDQGILHRDVKPANLMVTAADHRVVVMDLGLAALADASQSLTRDKGAILGTLRYLPPEQLQRSLLTLDRRADVYSLGATFYELLTGKPFFDGDSEVRLLEQVLRDRPVPPRVANPELPADLAVVLTKATEKDPRLRYDDAEALARDLEAWLDGRPIAARPPSLGYVLQLAIRRHRAVAAIVAASLVVAGCGATWFLVREHRLRGDAERARRDADTARGDAEHARDAARAAEQHAQVELARNLTEQGRVALLDQHPGRAASYLAAAYPVLPDDLGVRTLVARAMMDVERLRLTMHHDEGAVDAVFTPDGTRVVSAGNDRTAQLWDAATGARLATLRGHTDTLWSVVLSPDGHTFLTAGNDHTARLWDATTGAALHVLDGHAAAVHAVAFRPDGQVAITGAMDGTAFLWDVATGTRRATLTGHTAQVNGAAFSPDGRRVVTCSDDGTARIWDADTGAARATLRHVSIMTERYNPVGKSVDVAVFSPDGSRVTLGSEDGTIQIWDVARGALLTQITGNGVPAQLVTYSPDGGWLFTGGPEPVVHVWNATTGAASGELVGHGNDVTAIRFSPDGDRIATASKDGTARIWDGRSGTPWATLEAGTQAVWTVAFSPDGARLVTASADGSVRVWDAGLRDRSAVLSGHRGLVEEASFSRDGRRIVTSGVDGTARTWDAATGAPLATLVEDKTGFVAAAFDPGGDRVAVRGPGGTVQIVDTTTGAVRVTLTGHEDLVVDIAFVPDGTRVVTASADHTARIWDATSGALERTLSGHTAALMHVDVSPDGRRVVTASVDHTARIWDVATGAAIATLAHDDIVASARFSPDGARVVTASLDKTARIWDAATGAPVAAITGHANWVLAARFSPDGKHVLTASADNTATIWDAATGDFQVDLQGHLGWVQDAAWSPDGRRVITASNDKTAAIWDATTGVMLRQLRGHSERVFRTAFSPDGTRALTTGYDGLAVVWDVHLEARPPDAIAGVVAADVPWQVVDGRLVVR